jgi:hypothetical protein
LTFDLVYIMIDAKEVTHGGGSKSPRFPQWPEPGRAHSCGVPIPL